MKLDDTKLEELKPESKPYQVRDEDGLAIEVMPSGDKIWVFRYLLAGMPQGCLVGTYPKIDLVQARNRGKTLGTMIAHGVCPHL